MPVVASRFECLYREQHARLVGLARRLVGSQATAEDLVHDVFARCIDRLEDVDVPEAYLRRSVRNACWSWRRTHTLRREADRQLAGPMIVDADPIEFRDALSQLSAQRRAVVELRYFLGFPESEIAAILHCPVGTVKSTSWRALRELRALLETDPRVTH